MTGRRATAYGVLFAAAATLWLFTHGERTQVRRVFAVVERLAAKEPGEPVMECAAKSRALAGHFRDGCFVTAPGHGLDAVCSREDVAGGLLAFRSGAKRVAVKFRDLEIRIDGNEARVSGRVDWSGTEASWPGSATGSEGFLARLEKADGRWLVSRIKVP